MLTQKKNEFSQTFANVNRGVLAALFAGLALTTAPLAHAARGETVSVHVDLDHLDHKGGVEKVYRILSKKAQKSCEFSGGITFLKVSKLCTADLLNDFIVDVNRPVLSAYHKAVLSKP